MKKTMIVLLIMLLTICFSVVGIEAICGDGICYGGGGERVSSAPGYCPEDCVKPCGDGYCDTAYGENLATSQSYCEVDCPDSNLCGNGVCDYGENQYTCTQDCFCGDGKCDNAQGENYNCPEDCGSQAECNSHDSHFCRSTYVGCNDNEEKVEYDCPGLTSICCKQTSPTIYASDCQDKGYKCTDEDCGLKYDILDYSCISPTTHCCEDISICGDGVCEPNNPRGPENEETCPEDCVSCIDKGYKCSTPTMGCGLNYKQLGYKCPGTVTICCEDISTCGDGICDTKKSYPEPENKNTCPEDCWPDFVEEDEIVSSQECPEKNCVVKSNSCSGNDKLVVQECIVSTKIGTECVESKTVQTKILKNEYDCKTNTHVQTSCGGCQINEETCILVGTRLRKNDALYFCDIDKKMNLQLQINDECQNGYECESNNCKSEQCRPICEGCLDENNACLPVGSRINTNYCDSSYEYNAQLSEDQTCNNNYECDSNICVNNECISPSLIQKLLNWFKSIFS